MTKVTVKLEDLKKMTAQERNKLLQNLREQLRDIRFAVRSEQSQEFSRIRQLRKSIARVMTVINSTAQSEVANKVK